MLGAQIVFTHLYMLQMVWCFKHSSESAGKVQSSIHNEEQCKYILCHLEAVVLK